MAHLKGEWLTASAILCPLSIILYCLRMNTPVPQPVTVARSNSLRVSTKRSNLKTSNMPPAAFNPRLFILENFFLIYFPQLRLHQFFICSRILECQHYYLTQPNGWVVSSNKMFYTPFSTSTTSSRPPSVQPSSKARGYPFSDPNYAPLPMRPPTVTTFGCDKASCSLTSSFLFNSLIIIFRRLEHIVNRVRLA